MRFQWKIGGEAGFGIVTTGQSLSKILIRSGYHIFDYAEYPSLIRGGHNTYEIVMSDEVVSGYHEHVDMLVCLNKDTYTLHKNRLTAESVVVYDPDTFEPTEACIKVAIPFKKIRDEQKALQVMVNTIALGATLALIGIDLSFLMSAIEKDFQRKGQQVVDYNKNLANTGYEYIQKQYTSVIKKLFPQKESKPKLLLSGNDSFSLATIAADCRLYAAYPMTPASSVLMNLAAWQNKTGMVVRHAEDEISVINTALGASFAGVRSAVGSSGGGFALMVESLSFAGVAEIPIVVFLSQRPGPATGMPTWTEQGDLLFACFAGHGEFPKIVLAPGDNEEMLTLGLKAFDLADVYQLPVIIMSDKCLSENHIDVSKEMVDMMMSSYTPRRGKIVKNTQQKPYLRYQLTEDGISELLIPGAKGSFYQTNSYEHVEDSHTTEDAAPRIAQVEKRERKIKTYFTNDFSLPILFGDDEKARCIFVSWGGNKGVIQEAQRDLAEKGIMTAFMHFSHVYPLDVQRIQPLFKQGKRYILVENNATGQFGQLLRMQTSIDIPEKILKFDGRPLYTEEIVKYIMAHSS